MLARDYIARKEREFKRKFPDLFPEERTLEARAEAVRKMEREVHAKELAVLEKEIALFERESALWHREMVIGWRERKLDEAETGREFNEPMPEPPPGVNGNGAGAG